MTRALVAAGVPADAIFAAGFGAGHPVAPNDTSENRARNRRVEISPIPEEGREMSERLDALRARLDGSARAEEKSSIRWRKR